MVRKYLVANKSGVVSNRKISGRNLRTNYKATATSRGRRVYIKKGSESALKSRRYKIRYIAPKSQPLKSRVYAQERLGGGVEVTGLVSVSYESRTKTFHAEMLFEWYGKAGFDEEKLLDNAVEVLIDTLPEIERIPFELASMVAPDFDRRGIEQVREYDGDRENEMDFEIFIPKVGGRVLTTGSARIEA
jgi:hypothetical protein